MPSKVCPQHTSVRVRCVRRVPRAGPVHRNSATEVSAWFTLDSLGIARCSQQTTKPHSTCARLGTRIASVDVSCPVPTSFRRLRWTCCQQQWPHVHLGKHATTHQLPLAFVDVFTAAAALLASSPFLVTRVACAGETGFPCHIAASKFLHQPGKYKNGIIRCGNQKQEEQEKKQLPTQLPLLGPLVRLVASTVEITMATTPLPIPDVAPHFPPTTLALLWVLRSIQPKQFVISHIRPIPSVNTPSWKQTLRVQAIFGHWRNHAVTLSPQSVKMLSSTPDAQRRKYFFRDIPPGRTPRLGEVSHIALWKETLVASRSKDRLQASCKGSRCSEPFKQGVNGKLWTRHLTASALQMSWRTGRGALANESPQNWPQRFGTRPCQLLHRAAPLGNGGHSLVGHGRLDCDATLPSIAGQRCEAI